MEHLDCTGLSCPIPIVRLTQKSSGMASGQELTVRADDPAFRADLEAWLYKTGNELLSIEIDAGSVRAVIRRR